MRRVSASAAGYSRVTMRSPELTPAAHRAIAAASRWRSRLAGRRELGPVELLLGLLDESECRAALLLASRGVDAACVRRRWPDLEPVLSGSTHSDLPLAWSTEVRVALDEAQRRLCETAGTEPLATEHLLFGLLAAGDEVSSWLVDFGFRVDHLADEIRRRYGHSAEPLPMVEDDWRRPQRRQESPALSSIVTAHVAPPEPPTPPSVDRRATDDIAALRIIDAAANRAGEGLRVIEDYARFALDDRHLTARCKALRHELTAALSLLLPPDLLVARDTARDVGTDVTEPAESTRNRAADVAAASCHRVQQALRSLEEYSKLVDPVVSARLERLRYESYTLHRALILTGDSIARLAQARLYVLINGRRDADELSTLVEALVAAGVDVLQLRDKQLDDRSLIDRARIVRRLTRETETLFIVNDRPDIAQLVAADGVHIGQDEMSVREARRIVGTRALVGVSTHTIAQAQQAVADGADYIGVGPVFPSATKDFAEHPAIPLVAEVVENIRLPAFAIGGIHLDTIDQVLATGIGRVAVSHAINGAANPGDAAAEFCRRLDAARAAS